MGLALAVGAGSASAEEPSLEGIWSFGGGKVGIERQPDGSYAGIVVAPTKFAACTHELGERMWTEIRPAGDGSYQGLHQWFFDTDSCTRNPELGLSAWRVLRNGDGDRYLRACLAEPGSEQPTISPLGEAAVGAECIDSGLISELPAGGVDSYLESSPGGGCLKRKRLRIRIRQRALDPVSKAVVKLSSGDIHKTGKLRRRRGSLVATFNLSDLSEAPFTVTIRLTTVLGRHLSKKRTFAFCRTAASASAHGR